MTLDKAIKSDKKEQFCITCGYNYNSSESIYEAHEAHSGDLPTFGHPLCPKCCHKDWSPKIFPGYRIVKRDKATKEEFKNVNETIS